MDDFQLIQKAKEAIKYGEDDLADELPISATERFMDAVAALFQLCDRHNKRYKNPMVVTEHEEYLEW